MAKACMEEIESCNDDIEYFENMNDSDDSEVDERIDEIEAKEELAVQKEERAKRE